MVGLCLVVTYVSKYRSYVQLYIRGVIFNKDESYPSQQCLSRQPRFKLLKEFSSSRKLSSTKKASSMLIAELLFFIV